MLRVVGLDGWVVVGLDRCVVGRVVVLDVPERDTPLLGLVVVLVLFPTASLLVVPRVRVPTREGFVVLLEEPRVTLPFSDRTRLVLPTAVRVPLAVERVDRLVTIRPFLSRVTRELETRDVLPVRVLYPLRAAIRVGALRGLTLYRFPP